MLASYGCEGYRHLRRPPAKPGAAPTPADDAEVAECCAMFGTADRVVLAIATAPRAAKRGAAPAKKRQAARKWDGWMQYVVAPTPRAAAALVCSTPAADRCYYFVIEPERPVYAYLDFDAPPAAYASYASFRAAVAHALGAFGHFLNALYCTHLASAGRHDGAWHLYEACTARKWSMHAHANIVFESVAVLGRVVRRFVDALTDLRRVDARLDHLFMPAACGARAGECVVDCAVYNSRPFRLPWCAKTPGTTNYLRPLAPAADGMEADVLRAFVHAPLAAPALGAPAPPPDALRDLVAAPPQSWTGVCRIAERCLAAAAGRAHPPPDVVPLQLLLNEDDSPDTVLAWLAGASARRAALVCAMYALCTFCVHITGAEPDAYTAATLVHTAYTFCTSDDRERIEQVLVPLGLAPADGDAPTACGPLYMSQLYGALALCAAPPAGVPATDRAALEWLAAFADGSAVCFGDVGAETLRRAARHLCCVPPGLARLDGLALFDAPPHPASAAPRPAFLPAAPP